MGITDIGDAQFWVGLVQIIWIDLLLAGDNALVIGLACRQLQARHRLWGIVLGAGAAVLMRIFFTGIASTLMTMPYVKLVGAVALLYIAVKLLTEEGGVDPSSIEAHQSLWRAVKIIAVADLVMSLDNVIAVAAASRGNFTLLILGLLISIPLVVGGATLITALLTRLPILVWAGAALLGWIAGEIGVSDPLLHGFQTERFGVEATAQIQLTAAAAGAALVVLVSLALRRQRAVSRAKSEARAAPGP